MKDLRDRVPRRRVRIVNESYDHVSIQVMSVDSARYLTEFIRLRCSPDLLALRIYPDAKEISESVGAFRAAKHLVGTDALADRGVTLLDVGAGAYPRTAALFAYRTAWSCVAVDPRLNLTWPRWWTDKPKRLVGYSGKLSDFAKTGYTDIGPTVAVSVHGHVTAEEIRTTVKARPLHVVTIPCCGPEHCSVEPRFAYEDLAILSPKRLVFGWTFQKGE